MSIAHGIINVEKVRGMRLVFPEWDDARIVEATNVLSRDFGIEPCLADPSKATDELRDELCKAYVAGPRGSNAAIAARLIKKPLFYGAMLARTGRADAMIAGAAHPTKRVILSAAKDLRPTPTECERLRFFAALRMTLLTTLARTGPKTV